MVYNMNPVNRFRGEIQDIHPKHREVASRSKDEVLVEVWGRVTNGERNFKLHDKRIFFLTDLY